MAGGSHHGTDWSVAAFLPAVLPAVLFVWFAGMVPEVQGGATLRHVIDWVPSMGISLSFLIDGLSLTFALLITGIGAAVFLYAGQYLSGHEHYARFMLFLTSFMLAMLGLVTADNLIALFVFWELTTVTSYLLIGFDHATRKGRRNALQALLVTGTGGLALLAGFILIGTVAGSFELSVILSDPQVLKDHPWYLGILILVLCGAFTKSAQFPLHFWLPNAMAAPTPVSAYLHSATMVKGGVYLLARMHPGLGGTEVWFWTLTIFGGFTAVFASILAVRQTDLKQALAYTTLMALGTLVLFLGGSGAQAITGAATFLIVHSFYKACLFLVVGAIDHATGTREVARLSGLARIMPVTAFAAALAGLAMAGFPPFLGFIGKELLYGGAVVQDGSGGLVLGVAAFAANALMVAVAGAVALRPFWGKDAPQAEPDMHPHEAPWPMWIGPATLATLGLLFGLLPGLAQPMIHAVVASILPGAKPYDLYLWHGVNAALILSLATFAAGIVLYLLIGRLRAMLAGIERVNPIRFDPGWDRTLDGLKAFAAWQTRLVQSGVLRTYLRLTFLTLLAALGATMVARGEWPGIPVPDLLAKEWAVVVLILAGTLVVVLTGSRIAAIAGLGVVGIGVALVFIVYGAPDVAITQLLVETLVVVLVAVALLKMPGLYREGRVIHRPFDAVLGIALGAVVTGILLLVNAAPLDLRLTEYFETTAWPEAYGRNIVNVILVDFRALDTFGEIAVVMIAALSAFVLLKGIARGREDSK